MSRASSRPDARRRRPREGRRRLCRSRLVAALLGPPLAALAACGPGDGGTAADDDEVSGNRPAEDATAAVTAEDSARRAGAIGSMLRASAESWNAGDLDGFLDDYSADPGLTFSGAAGVTRGREAIRERYRESYWGEGVERDSLRFEELEVRPLGDDFALALGRYVLYRPEAGDSVTATGHFSLVLRREGDEWKIIHDHSS